MSAHSVAAPADLDAWLAAIARGFHDEPVDPVERASAAAVPEDRRVEIRADGRVAATAGAYPLELAAPGGEPLPTAGVTMVTVSPLHRRRGMLRAMMDALLVDAQEREEPLAALYASESGIYPRFGYGPAVTVDRLRADRAALAALPAPSGVGLVEPTPEEAARRWPAVLDAAVAERGVVLSRPGALWDAWLSTDDVGRDGPGPRRLVEVPGRGYLAYRVRGAWRDGLPDGTLDVEELVGADPEAELALWRHVADVDLVARVEASMRPAREPLWWHVADPLRVRRVPSSPLYVRLDDVVRALASRPYAADGAIVLSVADPAARSLQRTRDASGTYRLEVAEGAARATRVTGEPDLEIALDDLAGCWTGQTRATDLVAAGRAREHRPGAAWWLTRATAVPAGPWATFEF